MPGDADAMDKLAEYININDGSYIYKVVTTDWHPYFHCSFIANGGQWPMHCVQNTTGAALWQSLIEPLNTTSGTFEVLRKGVNKDNDEYSIFENEISSLRLRQIIEDNSIDVIDICGIAGNICVLHTLKDGIKLYGAKKFNVLTRFCPSLDQGKALNELINTI